MRILIVMLLSFVALPAAAQVYRCVGKHGAVSYQPSPCNNANKQEQLEIVSDPAKDAEAKARLEAVRSEYETRKINRQEADKQAMEQRLKQATADAAQRSANAQQDQADAQRRQADILERQGDLNDRPYLMVPPPAYPGYDPNPRQNPSPLDNY